MAAPRALISVYDKSGLDDLTAGLASRGWEFVASGGTATAIAAAGHSVQAVEDVTGAPEMLDGRVKTLHPAIHGGILARRASARHLAELTDLGIGTIDLVAVNLYPFAATLAATDDRADLLENIDIGGVALIRAAAKNPDDVWILVDPADYPRVLHALDGPQDPATLRRELAAKAFALTAFYDAHIAAYMQQDLGQSFPDLLTIPLRRLLNLRYGENPHQPGAFYAAGAAELGGSELSGVEQLHGLELSYINILDLQAAWASANDFDDIAVSIIKHTMPCCLAVHSESQAEAYRRARQADPVSAFGGIVGFNRTVTLETVAAMRGHLYHVVVAPDYDPDALRRLRRRKDLRIMRWPAAATRPPLHFEAAHVWGIDRGYLVQTPDRAPASDLDLRVVSRAQPTEADLEQLRFGLRVIRHVKSNAIVLVSDGRLIGLGSGQVNRVNAVRHATRHAGDAARGAYLASDAFFPFADGPEAALDAGVRAIVSVAGSLRDQEVIDAVDARRGILILVDERHFRH